MLFDPAKWALALGALARLSFAYHHNFKSVVGQGHHALAAELWSSKTMKFYAVLTDANRAHNTWLFAGSFPMVEDTYSSSKLFSHDAFVDKMTGAAEARGERFPSSGRVQIITLGPFDGKDAQATWEDFKTQLPNSSTQDFQYLPLIEIFFPNDHNTTIGAWRIGKVVDQVRAMMLENNARDGPLIIYVHCLRGGDRTGVVKAGYEMVFGGFATGATYVNGPRDVNEVWHQSVADVPDGRGMQEHWTFSLEELCRGITEPADCVVNATCGYEPNNPYGPFCI